MTAQEQAAAKRRRRRARNVRVAFRGGVVFTGRAYTDPVPSRHPWKVAR